MVMASSEAWTLALYERVVARLPPSQVAAASNRLLEEEFASVRGLVDDVAAAFAKVEEVGSAVSKLQLSSSSPGGRSVRLLSVLENVTSLQQQLDRKVEEMTVKLREKSLPKKRKAQEEAQTPQERKRTKRQREDKTEGVIPREAVVVKESSSESESDAESDEEDVSDVGVSEAALKTLMAVGSHKSNATKSKEELKAERIAVLAESCRVIANQCSWLSPSVLESIVKEVDSLPRLDRILVLPEVLETLKESVLNDEKGVEVCEVIDSLHIVIRWASTPSRQVHLFDWYHDYAETVEAYANRLPDPRRRTDLTRLSNELQAVLNGLKTYSDSEDALSQDARSCRIFVTHVKSIIQIPSSEQRTHLLPLLVMLKKAALTNFSRARTLKSVNDVARWVTSSPRDPQVLSRYYLFVKGIRAIMNVLTRKQQDKILRLTKRMVETFADTPSEKAKECLLRIKVRADKLLTNFNAWQTVTPAGKDINSKIFMLTKIVNNVTREWCPLQDQAVLSCAKILAKQIKRFRRKTSRKPYLEVLAKIMTPLSTGK